MSLTRATPLSSSLLRGLDDGEGKPGVEERQPDAGSHGAGAEDADRLDVAQLHVGADAGQVRRLPLGEERVLQRPGIGAGGRLTEERALARDALGQRHCGCRFHRIDGRLRRDGPAGMARERTARLFEQARRNLVDLLGADAARRLARLLLGEGDGGRDHVTVGQLVDQAGGGALGGVDEGARGDELQGLLHADRARQALRAAGARNDAELDLGQPELPHILGRDAVVAAQCQLQAAAERRAVHRGHHRLGRCLDRVDERGQQGLLHLALEFRDVGAGGEEPACARQHDGLDPGIGIGLAEGLLQPHAQRMAQRIHRRVVHADDGDVALLVRFHDCHGCAPFFTQYGCLPGSRLGSGLTSRLLCRHKAFQGG